MKRTLAVSLVLVLLVLALACAFPSELAFAETPETKPENIWETMADMPSAGMYEACVVDGKIYVFGDSVTYEYDPSADAWTTKTAKSTSGYFTVSAFQGKVYAFGEATEVYDPVADAWETRTVMPTVRSQMEANVVNGKIYLISGKTGGPYSTVNITEVYDPVTDSWTTKASIPYPVVSYASAVVDSRIYVIGGQDEFYPEMNVRFNQIYDAESDTWSQGALIPKATWQAAAGATAGVWTPKRIYVMGGEGGFADPLNQFFTYAPQTDTWSVDSSLPTALIDPAVAVVDDLVYVMGGGVAPYTSTAAVERYTPFLFGSVPVVSINSPENKAYPVVDVSLDFTVNEQVSWMGYSLDDQTNVTVVENMTLTELQEGVHSLVVYAEDMVGDVGSSETIMFTVDATSPIITILSPESEAYGVSEVKLNIGLSEDASRIVYSLDGNSNVTISGNTTLSGLSIGDHNVTVYAWDEAGNVGASEPVFFNIFSPESTDSIDSEPFPTTLILAIVVLVSVIAISAGLLFYFRKRRHRELSLVQG